MVCDEEEGDGQTSEVSSTGCDVVMVKPLARFKFLQNVP
jgi:hypothetical protein